MGAFREPCPAPVRGETILWANSGAGRGGRSRAAALENGAKLVADPLVGKKLAAEFIVVVHAFTAEIAISEEPAHLPDDLVGEKTVHEDGLETVRFDVALED